MKKINASELRRGFGQYLDSVIAGEVIAVQRDGRTKAFMVSERQYHEATGIEIGRLAMDLNTHHKNLIEMLPPLHKEWGTTEVIADPGVGLPFMLLTRRAAIELTARWVKAGRPTITDQPPWQLPPEDASGFGELPPKEPEQ